MEVFQFLFAYLLWWGGGGEIGGTPVRNILGGLSRRGRLRARGDVEIEKWSFLCNLASSRY